MDLESLYLKNVQKEFSALKQKGEKTIGRLNEEELYWRPTQSSNSVAILIQHLSGNMQSRWTDFLTTDGEKPNRHRDAEFEESGSSRADLLRIWESGWKIFLDTLDRLEETDLQRTVYIRGEAHTVMEAIHRQLSHYAYHIGQIVYIGKQLKGEEWNSLSIPKGESETYLRQKLAQSQPYPPSRPR
ncbi:DUF1572 family protein [Paludifilum halophilum]|uniref:DUF1572 domain-containing protein n=1 Tax=Paludifilum halophilum TaxID=1642702 RepID=A0A235B395_9BACL|nr:DUF1572 family protein [Paludifilum halophilum]OYD06770.1 hypothetical protein CHM34_14540 [Paludifilum halophilum]